MDPDKQQPAVFLDRDGTLVEDRGHLKVPSDVVFFHDTFDALRRLQRVFRLFIVTHQPGVAERTVSMEDVERVNNHIVTQLAESGVSITATYVCPHMRADGCGCIKPKPHFLLKAAEDFSIDLRRSFVIGDHPHDVTLAHNAGAEGIYVCTGHGLKHLAELPDRVLVAGGIGEAADCILSPSRKPRGWKTEIGESAHIIQRCGLVPFPTEKVFQHAEIHPLDENTVELRYLEGPRSVPYRAWTMPIQEAADLVEWWTQEGVCLRGSHTPIRNHRVGTILISVCSFTTILVRSLDKYGNLKPAGYDIPLAVVEELAAYMLAARPRCRPEGKEHHD